MFSFATPPLIPYMRYEEYSRLSGMPMGTIKQYVTEGKIIIKKKEKPHERPLINMVAMTEIAAREAIEKLG